MSDFLLAPSIEDRESAILPHSQIPTSELSAMGASFGESLTNSIGSTALEAAQSGITRLTDPGKFVPSNQVPASFKSKYPNGTYSNVLAQKQVEQNMDINYQNTLANAPQGTWNNVGIEGAGLLGGVLDPGGILVGGGLGKLGEIGLGLSKGAIGESVAAKTAASAVAGMGEGASFTAINNTAQYLHQKDIGNDSATLDVMNGWGLPTLLGGVIHGAIGRTKAMKEVYNQTAEQVAKAQMANGDIPDVSPVIKQGIYDTITTKAAEQGISTPDFPDGKLNMHQGLTEVSDKLNDQISDIDNKLNEIPDHPETSSTTLNTLNRAWSMPKFDATPWKDSDLKFWNKTQDIPYMRDLFNATMDNPAEITTDQQSHIDNLASSRNYEQKLLKTHMDQHAEDINNLRDEISNEVPAINDTDTTGSMRNKVARSDLGVAHQDDLVSRINHLGRLGVELNAMLGRKAELAKLKDVDNAKLTDAHSRGKLLLRRNTLQNLKDHTDAQLSLVNASPVSTSELTGLAEASKRGDRQANVRAATGQLHADRESELQTNKDLSYYENQAQKMVDEDRMSKETSDAVEHENGELDDAHEQFSKALPDLVSCLFGGA